MVVEKKKDASDESLASIVNSMILPKFSELDAFSISLSLILSVILFPGVIPQLQVDTPGNILIIGMLLFIVLYPLLMSLYYALTPRIPDKADGGSLVYFCLTVTVAATFLGAHVWISELVKSDNPVDRVFVIFPVLGALKAYMMMEALRSERTGFSPAFGERFVYRNAPQHTLILATSFIIAAGIFGALGLGLPAIMVFLMMIEAGQFAAAAPRITL